eukprot:2742184-Pyramimonas_sp.AAC.1
MVREHWKTGQHVEVMRDHLLDALLHYGCYGRLWKLNLGSRCPLRSCAYLGTYRRSSRPGP